MAGFQLLSRAGRNSVFSWLAFLSVCFYAYWNVKMTAFLGASVVGNFLIAQWIARSSSEKGKRLWLIAGIVLNLAALAYFKYLFPLLDFLHAHGLSGHDFGNVVLPLGISFFTFTQIGYLVDLEQGQAQSQDFVGYTLFVTFFPHLIAGPIVHHREMMPQFAERRRGGLCSEDVAIGISWFFIGLFKKVIIADTLAPVADAVFAHPQGYGLAAQWTGVLCYSLQLYFDFSGYSDMAVALARIFSIRFPLNFNSPYKAANVIDFWQRWHMTLTRYLTLYVYDPIAVAITRRRLTRGKSVSKKGVSNAGRLCQPGGFTDRFHDVRCGSVARSRVPVPHLRTAAWVLPYRQPCLADLRARRIQAPPIPPDPRFRPAYVPGDSCAADLLPKQ